MFIILALWLGTYSPAYAESQSVVVTSDDCSLSFKLGWSKFNGREDLFQGLTPEWGEVALQESLSTYRDGRYEALGKLWNDRAKFVAWAEDLRSAVRRRMDLAGVKKSFQRFPTFYEHHYYLEMAARAERLGFQVDREPSMRAAYPFILMREVIGNGGYHERMRNAEFTIDRAAGSRLSFKWSYGFLFHSSDGHALQLLYAAEHLPNFITLYREMADGSGQAEWNILFDNRASRGMTNPGIISRIFAGWLRGSVEN